MAIKPSEPLALGWYSMSNACALSPAEVAPLLRSIIAKCGGVSRACVVLGVRWETMTRWLYRGGHPGYTVRAHIWLVWRLLHAKPGEVITLFELATWGRFHVQRKARTLPVVAPADDTKGDRIAPVQTAGMEPDEPPPRKGWNA